MSRLIEPTFKLVPYPEDDSPESVIQRTGDKTYFCPEPLPNHWAEVVVVFCNAAYAEGRADAEKDIWANADSIAYAEAAGQCPMPVPTRYAVGRDDGHGGYGMLAGPFDTEQQALECAGSQGDCVLRLGMDGRTIELWNWNSDNLRWEN